MDELKAKQSVLDDLWAWLDEMPETYDFQALGEKLSELGTKYQEQHLGPAPEPKKYA